MYFLSELEEIKKMRDIGDEVEIQTTRRNYLVPKTSLKFYINDEIQIPHFQNSGANTICYSTWEQIKELMETNNIKLPDAISPCHNCDGKHCRFWCPKH